MLQPEESYMEYFIYYIYTYNIYIYIYLFIYSRRVSEENNINMGYLSSIYNILNLIYIDLNNYNNGNLYDNRIYLIIYKYFIKISREKSKTETVFIFIIR